MKIIILMLFIASLSANTSFALQLTLRESADGVCVMLMNNSTEKKRINKLLAHGPEGSNSSIFLAIKNKAGVHFDFARKITRFSSNPSEHISYMQPNESLEIFLEMQEIVKDYELKSGEYTMQAIYRNDFYAPKIFVGTLTSNEIDIKIKEGAEEIWEKELSESEPTQANHGKPCASEK